MRTTTNGSLAILGCLLFMSCGDKDKENNNGETGDTSTEVTEHPLVPDEYQNIWDWDASGCEDGKSAVYHVAEGSSVEEEIDGATEIVLYVTERWYWFHGDEDFDGDCVDEFEYRGVETSYAWGSIDPCGTCEEEYWGSYDIVDTADYGCNYLYGGIIIGRDASGEGNDFSPMVFKIDTLTIAGEPNENNAILVYNAISYDGGWYFDSSYAKGTVFPDSDGDYGGPSQYEWVNLTTMCI